jgi:hypothetical protein
MRGPGGRYLVIARALSNVHTRTPYFAYIPSCSHRGRRRITTASSPLLMRRRKLEMNANSTSRNACGATELARNQ